MRRSFLFYDKTECCRARQVLGLAGPRGSRSARAGGLRTFIQPDRTEPITRNEFDLSQGTLTISSAPLHPLYALKWLKKRNTYGLIYILDLVFCRQE